MKKVLIVLFSLLPILVFAHSDETSFETTSNGYLVDIGYSDASTNELIRFDFAIYKEDSKKEVPFKSVWVNISKDQNTIYAGPVAYGEFGKPGMSLIIPEEGKYTVSARFEGNNGTLAETSFPITVTASNENAPNSSNYKSVFLILGGICLALIGFMVGRMYSKK
jgi:hypothetical protein